MSAENGNGPTPAEPSQAVQITKQITRLPRSTVARKEGDGLQVTFIVEEGGQPEQHTYIVGPPGKQAISDAITGGIEVIHEMPRAAQENPPRG